jgi:hypothetical protein
MRSVPPAVAGGSFNLFPPSPLPTFICFSLFTLHLSLSSRRQPGDHCNQTTLRRPSMGRRSHVTQTVSLRIVLLFTFHFSLLLAVCCLLFAACCLHSSPLLIVPTLNLLQHQQHIVTLFIQRQNIGLQLVIVASVKSCANISQPSLELPAMFI